MFVLVQQVPGADDAAIGIAQQIEGEIKLGLQQCRRPRRVDRYCRQVETGGTDGVEVITKVRQLANAERSPMAAVEHQHHLAAAEFLEVDLAALFVGQ